MKKNRKTQCQRDRLHDKLEMVDEAYLDIIEERMDSFIGKSLDDISIRPSKKRK